MSLFQRYHQATSQETAMHQKTDKHVPHNHMEEESLEERSIQDKDSRMKQCENEDEQYMSDQELTDDYDNDSYPLIEPCQSIHNRYYILRKLGWGACSTVWLAWDLHEKKAYALKISMFTESSMDAINDEIEILDFIKKQPKSLQGYHNIAHIDNHFIYNGSNGKYMIFVFDVCGPSLLRTMQSYKDYKIPFDVLKRLIPSFLSGLIFLHDSCKILHTDLKPENVMIKFTEKKKLELVKDTIDTLLRPRQLPENYITRVSKFKNEKDWRSYLNKKRMKTLNGIKNTVEQKYANVSEKGPVDDMQELVIGDFGLASFFEKKFTDKIATRQYRAPEILLGYKEWDQRVDVWAAACTIYEAAAGYYLFKPNNSKRRYSRVHDHLRLIWEIRDETPKDFLGLCKKTSKYLDKNGNIEPGVKYDKSGLTKKIEHCCDTQDQMHFLNRILAPMLLLDPRKRSNASEVYKFAT
ncbi:MAG: SRSF protein kinase 3 [Marteilia pararefringens]